MSLKTTIDELSPILNKICTKAVKKESVFCKHLLNEFEVGFVENFLHWANRPEIRCTQLFLCNYSKVEDTFEDFIKVTI